MIIVEKGSNCDIVGPCKDGVIKIVKFHNDFLVRPKKSVPDSHLFLEVPEDAGSNWHGCRGSPYLDVTEE